MATASDVGLSFTPLRLGTANAQSTFGSNWRFPAITTATSANNTPVEASAPPRNAIAGIRVRAGGMGHVKQRSLSAPIAMPAEFEAGCNDLEVEQGLGDGYGWGQMAATANKWAGTGTLFGQQQQPFQQEQQYAQYSDPDGNSTIN
jgi:hypothetical protein